MHYPWLRDTSSGHNKSVYNIWDGYVSKRKNLWKLNKKRIPFFFFKNASSTSQWFQNSNSIDHNLKTQILFEKSSFLKLSLISSFFHYFCLFKISNTLQFYFSSNFHASLVKISSSVFFAVRPKFLFFCWWIVRAGLTGFACKNSTSFGKLSNPFFPRLPSFPSPLLSSSSSYPYTQNAQMSRKKIAIRLPSGSNISCFR